MISWSDPALWAETVFEAVAGETLTVEERLVVAPCDGRLEIAQPDHATTEGEYVVEGQVVGKVVATDGRTVPVTSPFAGWLMGYLVPHRSPVRASEPVLWLRRL